MKPKRQLNLPILEISIALMIILLPLSNNPDLMNGIQTAKSFNFFYSILFLMGLGSLLWLFKKDKLKLTVTPIDILLLAYVSWVSINKYLVHDVYCFSLKYYELLGLSVLYLIIRLTKQKYYLLFLVAICISGTTQAVYGCLQLWGFYPSNHGLFKMTGSFFNPGPYAGFLAIILPIALGLYWSVGKQNEKQAFDQLKNEIQTLNKWITSLVSSRRKERSVSNKRRFLNILGKTINSNIDATSSRTIIEALKTLFVKYIALTAIITILLVLPAARSRAAWLGAIAGCIYLAWHNYKATIRIKAIINGRTKSPLGDIGVKMKRVLLIFITTLILTGSAFTLYHYKKDSADGRILIWTVTSNIIKDYPIVGVGQDLFKAHYMDYQADYFRNHPNSKYETVADDNQYAFNEFLNTFSENGIIGIVLLLGILGFVFFSKTTNPVIARRNDEAICYSKDSKRTDSFAMLGMTGNLNPETIIRAAILSLLVFGLFAYPNEILPSKMVVIICIALLAGMKMVSLKREETSFVSLVINTLRPLWFKYSFIIVIIAIIIFIAPQVRNLKKVYTTWNEAFELYNFGLYTECLKDYEKAYPQLQHNGEFMINYGKALSIAEKHTETIEILGQAKNYQTNTVLYTALGDSQKALKEFTNAEKNYWLASNMAPGKFYPQYLLAKLYDESLQHQKAIDMATILLNKEVKIESTAIVEIKEEMRKIIEANSNINSQLNSIDNETMNGEKGRNNHTTPQKYSRITLPQALSKYNSPKQEKLFRKEVM